MNPATFGHIYHVPANRTIMYDPKNNPSKAATQILGSMLNGPRNRANLVEFQVNEPEANQSPVKVEHKNKAIVAEGEQFNNAISAIKDGNYTFINVGRLKQLLGDGINKILKPDQLKDDKSAVLFMDIPHTTQGTHMGHSAFENVTMTDDDAVTNAAQETINEWTETLGQSIKTIMGD